MRRIGLLVGTALMMGTLALTAQQPPAYKDASLPIERRVADLLSRMTLEEKVAQTLAVWQQKRQLVDANGAFDPAKAGSVLQYGIGQITRPSDGVDRGGKRRTPRETVELVNAIQRWVIEHTRLAIPVMFHEEALHGLAAVKGTNFPVPIGLASTWDPALDRAHLHRGGAGGARARRAAGALARGRSRSRSALGTHRGNLRRGSAPRLARSGWRRSAAIRDPAPGLTAGHVFATAKHFAAHGPNEGGHQRSARRRCPSASCAKSSSGRSSARSARDTWPRSCPPTTRSTACPRPPADSCSTKSCVRNGNSKGSSSPTTTLSSSSPIDIGSPRSMAEAAALALAAGVDLELPDRKANLTLVEEVRAGRLDAQLLDRAVARMLRLKFLAGLFEHPYADADEAERVTNTADAQALALDAARASLVLLKNDGALPLDRAQVQTLAVIGPNAADVHLGGYSEDPGRGDSILQGIKNKAGTVKVVFAEGCRITEGPADWNRNEVTPADPAKNAQRIAEAVAIARTADADRGRHRHERIHLSRSVGRQPPRRHGRPRPDQSTGRTGTAARGNRQTGHRSCSRTAGPSPSPMSSAA